MSRTPAFGKPSRREFLKQSTAVSTAFWVAGSGASWAQPKSPIEKLNFASIGVDGKGSSDSDDASTHGNMVAICDIDENRLNKKAEKLKDKFPDVKKFTDYREMLTKMEKEIDAVTVSTPDHSHAPASMMAMKLGKHCFTQKPLTWSVYEARKLREFAAEKKVATQMGNQGTSENGLREAVEVVRAGLIGTAKEVHIWTNRPIWPQGTGRPKDAEKCPDNVHWDLFLGPAADRPYNSAYHPFKWRGWIDFGTGALGDMACHTANMAVMALNLFDPLTIEAETSGIVENETYPKNSKIKFEFGARGDRGPVTLYWYDGGQLPSTELAQLGPNEKLPSSGSLIVGDKGTLYSPSDYGASYSLLPKDNFKDVKKPEPKLPRSPGHFKEFVIACSGGPAAMSNFSYAGHLTETILLGNVAMRAGKKLEWDAANMKIKNAPEAEQYLHREYRKGWSL
jgi:predicted dehydrogenase